MVVVSGGWAKSAVAVQPTGNAGTHQYYQPIVVLDNMVITESQQQCNNSSATIVGQRGGGSSVDATVSVSVSALGGGNSGAAVTDPVIGMCANGCARAELHCRPNSYHFQKRVLSLQQPAKVGRSVARARAAHDNAIFDCKVLSRHHAILWYDAGKFYLQDTNSSNGTFVNNSRLPSSEAQPHEVNSGDIVQFGVDVVENNKKVTHGCIIATLKLYMPDGKEAKASPSISETNNQCVPLDELYKLNQIIQEASQREICLESKLTALQHIVEQTRKSADESWQAYVGEERLLSRVATLENQLTQAGKNWSDDRLKLEINKLQDEKTDYQYSAKMALEKVHGERLEAVKLAAEQQRARAAVEQDTLYTKEQLEQAQEELQEIAQKLIAEEKKTSEIKADFEQKQKELLRKLDEETQQVFELHNALVQLRQAGINANSDILEKYNIICTNDNEIDDLKYKEDIIKAENETELNRSNGLLIEPEINHINNHHVTSVSPEEASEVIIESKTINSDDVDSDSSDVSTITSVNVNECISDSEDDSNSSINSGNDSSDFNNANSVIDDLIQAKESEEENLKYCSEEKQPDAKTLKYHVESVHSHYQHEIALLTATQHNTQRHLQQITAHRTQLARDHATTLTELDRLRDDHHLFKETQNECQQLRDRLTTVQNQYRAAQETLRTLTTQQSRNCDADTITALETQLIALKERYVHLADEKDALNKGLERMRGDYNALCNRSYNTMFCYVAPLVFMVVYLLVSSMFS